MQIDAKDIGCTEEELYDFYLHANHMLNCRGPFRPNEKVVEMLKKLPEKIKLAAKDNVSAMVQ